MSLATYKYQRVTMLPVEHLGLFTNSFFPPVEYNKIYKKIYKNILKKYIKK